MAYVEIRTTLPGHRKVAAAARVLGIPRPAVIGHLVCFWAWALENVGSSGSLAGVEAMDIAHAAGWPAKQRRTADRFVRDLVKTGWISDEDGELFIHDWADYAGRLLTKREADAARKRAERAESRSATAGVQRTSSGRRVQRTKRVQRTSAGPRARAVAPHRTAPTSKRVETEEAPPARATPTAGRTAGASSGSNRIELDRPDVTALRRRGWTRLSAKQLATLDEVAWRQCTGDPEQRPGVLVSGQAWSGRIMATAPKGAKLLEHLLATERRIRDERTAAADVELAAHTERVRGGAGPIAAELGQRLNGAPGVSGQRERLSREELIDRFRAYRGQIADDVMERQLTPHGLTLVDLEDPVDFGAGPPPEAPADG